MKTRLGSSKEVKAINEVGNFHQSDFWGPDFNGGRLFTEWSGCSQQDLNGLSHFLKSRVFRRKENLSSADAASLLLCDVGAMSVKDRGSERSQKKWGSPKFLSHHHLLCEVRVMGQGISFAWHCVSTSLLLKEMLPN